MNAAVKLLKWGYVFRQTSIRASTQTRSMADGINPRRSTLGLKLNYDPNTATQVAKVSTLPVIPEPLHRAFQAASWIPIDGHFEIPPLVLGTGRKEAQPND